MSTSETPSDFSPRSYTSVEEGREQGVKFVQIRHKAPTQLRQPRPLVIACSPLKSHVNLSAVLRIAGCAGVSTVIASGNAKVNARVARDGADTVQLTTKNTLPPTLRLLKAKGYTLVGLEQTTNSQDITTFSFPHACVLVIGSERQGLSQAIMDELDHTIEIPIFGLPFSHNVATATGIAVYEYCRQFPDG